MRYRKLTPSGDYSFGSGQLNFYIDEPNAVGQAVETSLKLWLGEWYLNTDDGTPYMTGVLGKHPDGSAEATLRRKILSVQGMVSIESFELITNPDTRSTTVTTVLNTIYGITELQVSNYVNY